MVFRISSAKLVFFFQHVVERVTADDIAQRRQRDLRDGGIDISHAHHRLGRVHDPVPDNGVDLDGDVILGDGFLLFDRRGNDALIDQELPLDEGQEKIKAGAAFANEAAQAQNDAALIFLGYANAHGEQNED